MTRRQLNLNRDWKFLRDDVPDNTAAARDFDDSAWQPVGLPHTFDLPYFRTPEFYVGVGWYRKRFEVSLTPAPSPTYPAERAGERGETREAAITARSAARTSDRSDAAPLPPQPTPLPIPLPGVPGRGGRVFLEFDGVFQAAEVFVNGHPVGGHRGGYTGFSIDITEAALPGANVLAIRVNNHWDAQLQPRAGEHVFCGGIYRDVHLVHSEALHVTWNGTRVTTPQVSAELAIVRIGTEVCNESDDARPCNLKSQLSDPNGRIVTTVESHYTLPPQSTHEFDQTTPPIVRPMLWHPDHPSLYTVRTQVFADDELVDEYESPLGFRWFEWTADRGFFLNGERLYLRGANAHQDHAGWGIAITRAACERDVRLIKEAGFNFVRGAHYPHHPAFADACDRLGLIFWSENAFWGKGGFGPEGYWNASAYPVNEADFEPFAQSSKQQLDEMIRINRNHPSIVVWSMTNEAFFTYNLGPARELMRDLVKLSRELDPTRLAAIGGAQRGDVDAIGDVAGYNGDGARLFMNPGVPNLVSEYGAISKPHDAFDPFFGDLQPEDFPWRGGQAIWAGFDYGSIAGKQGLKGILNHQRLPKRSWYWYRNEYRKIPPPPWPVDGTPAKLFLDADKTTIDGTDATDDCQLVVTVQNALGRHVSASPPVTLTIESGPGEFPTGRSITFVADSDIGIAQGQCAMAFRSYHGGTSLIRATSPGLVDATIEITTIGEPGFAPGVTDLVPDRRYTPPEMSPAAIVAMRNAVNVAFNRPSRASAEAGNHPARFGNDGLPETAWSAPDNQTGAWWQVDLEGFYQVSSSRLTFPAPGNWRFTIETSRDGINWSPAVDRTATENTAPVRNDVYPPGAIVRHLRITFTAMPPGLCASLADVELYGVLSVR